MKIIRALLPAIAAFCLTSPAFGQSPSSVVPPLPACKDVQVSIDVSELARHASQGHWTVIEPQLKSLRDSLKSATCLPTGDEQLIVVFRGQDGLGENILHAVLYPAGEPFTDVLPGLSAEDKNAPQLYEVFVADRARAALKSTYVATRVDDPLQAQTLTALSANFGTVLTLAGAAAGAPAFAKVAGVKPDAGIKTLGVDAIKSKDVPPPPPPPPPVISFATASQINLSVPRSKIEVNRRALVPPRSKEISDAVKKMVIDLKLREARDSAAAKSYADDIAGILDTALAACDQAPANDCRETLAAAAAGRFARVAAGDREAVEDTNVRVRNFIADLGPTKIDQKATLNNEPKRRVGIEAMTAYIFAAGDKVRVKANGDSTKIVVDPLPRVLTAVGVSLAFKKFQPSIGDSMKGPTAYVGATLTPNFGVAAAFSYRVINGLSLTVGTALLGIPTGELGAEPPKDGKPFKTVGQGVAFAGLTFNVK